MNWKTHAKATGVVVIIAAMMALFIGALILAAEIMGPYGPVFLAGAVMAVAVYRSAYEHLTAKDEDEEN